MIDFKNIKWHKENEIKTFGGQQLHHCIPTTFIHNLFSLQVFFSSLLWKNMTLREKKKNQLLQKPNIPIRG